MWLGEKVNSIRKLGESTIIVWDNSPYWFIYHDTHVRRVTIYEARLKKMNNITWQYVLEMMKPCALQISHVLQFARRV
jgi:hypothetical protein